MPTLLDRLDPLEEATLRHLIGGAIRTQAIYVAAKLGIADHLALGPRGADELAEHTGTHATTLRRVLRYLVSIGVFAEREDGRFALNGIAEYLQTAHPRSLRPTSIRSGEGQWQVAARLFDAVRTGRTPYEEVHGAAFFERHSGAQPELAFAARMTSSTAGLGAALARLDSVAGARRVVDVGGGHGAILLSLLEAQPQLEGVLFDRAATIESAKPGVARHASGARCALVAGDFFQDVPAGDLHLLSWILHDWSDADAVRILRACRAAGGAGAKVLIVEALLPERAIAAKAPVAGALADPFTLDLQMLLLTGGRERTLGEYCELLRAAGYEAQGTTTLASARGASVIEAAAV